MHPHGRIIVCAHMDTKYHTQGALDNAAGVAVLLSAAAGLSKTDCNVDIVPFNGEEYYEACGEVEYLKRLSPGRDEVALVINIDSPCHAGSNVAHSSSIDELLRLILDGATVTVWDDESDDEVPSHEAFWECADYDDDEDEDEELLFGPDEIRDAFASKVRAIGSMDSIRSITISGSEDGWSNVDYCQEFIYDCEMGVYTGKISGYKNVNGSGGELYFDDIHECEITEEYDGLREDEEDEEYEAGPVKFFL